MYNSDTELMFPMRVAPSLKTTRGELWSQLVEDVSREGADLRDQSAFVLLMVKLGGCVACNSDSFRAMRGCTQCARQTIRRYRGSDQDLLALFQQYRADVENHLNKG
ncbi:hypothetical protein LARV_02340 [Longilinea arvoryzae]|uniref:Uncharacterized protein n=1 Tax=Longilinea arvoryzae TaxID=360412 RepID=A0A0S7BAK2_9CHLR|nr:hypothetical protein [Longilinea arvoryzae]GAP14567.1 hypothetical protein LARV_02340 [Longilinea arvoryzae]